MTGTFNKIAKIGIGKVTFHFAVHFISFRSNSTASGRVLRAKRNTLWCAAPRKKKEATERGNTPLVLFPVFASQRPATDINHHDVVCKGVGVVRFFSLSLCSPYRGARPFDPKSTTKNRVDCTAVTD